MGRSVEIRPMIENDLRGVFLLGRELFGEGGGDTWNETSLAGLLASNLEHSLIAIRGRSTAGFIIPEVFPNGTVCIRWIAWREGDEIPVAAPLLEAFQSSLSGKHLTAVRIMIGSENLRLIELCKNFCFTELQHILMMGNFFPKNER
ncbi:MAG: hypothetical protein E4G96_03360 [Chrysiogenales bacterium]|nr:MAG: hypothetical protein E4G96_03360 [Chrysiogenales bacterium]